MQTRHFVLYQHDLLSSQAFSISERKRRDGTRERNEARTMVLHVLTTFVIHLAVKIAGQTLNKTTDLIQVSLSLAVSAVALRH